MTDPRLTPDQEERVRRLLAEARHTGPMPPELVARFDALIDGLARDGDGEAAPPPADPVVVPLAGRRRLRGLGAVLVAAATITVLGTAGQQFTQGLSGSGGSDDAASTAIDEDAGADALEPAAPEGGEAERPTDSGRDTQSKQDRAQRMALARQAREVRPDRFRADAKRLAPLATAATSDLARKTACAGAAAWSEGDRVPASYDGRLGALVYRAPTPEGQEVELFLCGIDGPVRTTTLPAPDVAP